MGRTVIAVFCLAALPLVTWGQTITVTTPTAGTTYWQACGIWVKWTYSGLPDTAKVKILLYRNGVYQAHLAKNVPISDRQRLFEMLYSPEASDIPSGAGYTFRVQTGGDAVPCQGDSAPFIYYHDYFTGGINPPSSPMCGNYEGAKVLKLTTSYTICWRMYSPSQPATARIELWWGNAPVGVIADNVHHTGEISEYSYNWTVGQLIGGAKVIPRAGYRIRILFHPAFGGEMFGYGSPFTIAYLSGLLEGTMPTPAKK